MTIYGVHVQSMCGNMCQNIFDAGYGQYLVLFVEKSSEYDR